MIICLCGSTRFKESFEKLGAVLALEGHIVFSPQVYSHYSNIKLSPQVEAKLLALSKSQIDMSDEVYFLTGEGEYVGQSGYQEICYARKQDKPITYFSNSKVETYVRDAINNYILEQERIKKMGSDEN